MADQPTNRYRYLLSLDQFPTDLLATTNLEAHIDAWIEQWKYKDCMCTQGANKFRLYIIAAITPSGMRKRIATHFSSHVRGSNGLSRSYGGVRYSLTQAKLSHEEVMKEMLMGEAEDAVPPLVHCTWVFKRHPTDLHARYWEDRRVYGDEIGPPAPKVLPIPRWSDYVSTQPASALSTVHDIATAICTFHSRDISRLPEPTHLRRIVAEIQEWVRLQSAAGSQLCRDLGLVDERGEEQKKQEEQLEKQRALLEKQQEQLEKQRALLARQQEHLEKQQRQFDEMRVQREQQQRLQEERLERQEKAEKAEKQEKDRQAEHVPHEQREQVQEQVQEDEQLGQEHEEQQEADGQQELQQEADGQQELPEREEGGAVVQQQTEHKSRPSRIKSKREETCGTC